MLCHPSLLFHNFIFGMPQLSSVRGLTSASPETPMESMNICPDLTGTQKMGKVKLDFSKGSPREIPWRGLAWHLPLGKLQSWRRRATTGGRLLWHSKTTIFGFVSETSRQRRTQNRYNDTCTLWKHEGILMNMMKPDHHRHVCKITGIFEAEKFYCKCRWGTKVTLVGLRAFVINDDRMSRKSRAVNVMVFGK